MALIEGVGDEVTLLFGVVFLMLVLVLAWISTHTSEPPEAHGAPAQGSTSSADAESQEPLAPGDSHSEEDRKTETGTARGAEAHGSDGGTGDVGGNRDLLDVDGLRHRDVPGPSPTTPATDSASSTTPTSTPEDEPNNIERTMVVRLKFLNDTEQLAHVSPENTIGFIKRTYFPGQEHQVRLIYQGQLLQDDTQTLASLHLADNCVLHCHISQHATQAVPAGTRAADQVHMPLNLDSLMVPLFVLMLSVLWYFQFQYRQFFSAPTTASLVGITIFFSFVAFGVYRR